MKKLIFVALLLGVGLLSSPALATRNYLQSAYSKGTTTAEFLTELDTTIVVASTSSSWFALVQLTANNTTPNNATVQILLRESLVAVPDNSVTVTLQPGTGTYQLPVQFQGIDLGLGSHTFRVRVNQSTNSPIIYQTTSFLELADNTGTGGVVSGGGDVTGPASSILNDVAVFADTTGKVIKDPGFWSIDVSGNLVTPGGSIGIGTASPSNRFTVTETVTGGGAVLASCAGAITASASCVALTDTASSGTAGVTKAAQAITVCGTNNGSGALSVGTIYSVVGSSTPTAIYVTSGSIVTNDRVAIGGDLTPDALLDIDNSSSSVNNALFTQTGAGASPVQTLVIAQSRTGGASGVFKSGIQVSSVGSWAGPNVAILAQATDGAEANVAFLGLTGDFVAVEGQMKATITNPTRTAFLGECTSSTGCASAHNIDMNGTDAVFLVRGDGDGTGAPVGLKIDLDGDGAPIAKGILVDVTDSADAEAIRVLSGNVDFGDPGAGEGFAYTFATKQTTLNGGPTSTTAAILEVHNDEDEIGIKTFCTATGGGDDCIDIEVTNDGSGTVGGLGIITNGGGGGLAIGATLSATNATDKIALNVLEGDAVFGVIGLSEDLRYHQVDQQFIFGQNDGTAVNPGGNLVEITQVPGDVGLEMFGSSTGANLATNFTGAVTAASTSVVISNTQTSGTNAINKAAMEVDSTGTFNGTGAINAGIRAVASGGTRNFAFWAQTGGILSDSVTLNPISSAPLTCNATNEGTIAYDSDISLTCVCSDSDGGTFEWEVIGERATDCFT